MFKFCCLILFLMVPSIKCIIVVVFVVIFMVVIIIITHVPSIYCYYVPKTSVISPKHPSNNPTKNHSNLISEPWEKMKPVPSGHGG